jgi:hypothetical protein
LSLPHQSSSPSRLDVLRRSSRVIWCTLNSFRSFGFFDAFGSTDLSSRISPFVHQRTAHNRTPAIVCALNHMHAVARTTKSMVTFTIAPAGRNCQQFNPIFLPSLPPALSLSLSLVWRIPRQLTTPPFLPYSSSSSSFAYQIKVKIQISALTIKHSNFIMNFLVRAATSRLSFIIGITTFLNDHHHHDQDLLPLHDD